MSNTSSRLGTALLVVAIIAVLAIGTMMFGAHLDLWQPVVGFRLTRNYMNPIAYAVISLAVVGLIYQLIVKNPCGAIKAGVAGLIGLGLLSPTIYSQLQPQVRLPPIHDISTDTNNPPVFLVLDETREGARNTLEYGGPEVAKQQKKAYPDIVPIQSSKSPSEAFSEALRVADVMGWEIIAQDSNVLRFEATARTPVYQFADDIVVVVTPEGAASRVDIRSVSRIGRGDRGVNAARIREFVAAFQN
ncbi:DUF1499 domain-containing protein [Marinomonas sp. C2222]|uniref:DUF1499 domain-containing protein n=1 Tax=Marinomonas sargassi TaxID=2984494 RepID=A0ABT2YNW6_9GAMM|nr:DUF1499 domain-containing protein [Marinomonas sargassi]MCV2401588.1 DUF1499 domain-containing protein [Marinomonas sargassi]